ncbi:TIGR03118 family protein [Actinocrispum wychmicini]|uniref:Uncharacterized protein (TIGR03118 family) n=1 Tax=Actinocrispum wychmicini TaxID=1213861 RepID=A0A4R2JIK2_9PSEU|nr:TIGR03118 family protein [Actinocrispum wychmicini]TCO59731.1 uncharacterized protein (TIGR03118 family) [Actinocrispum wychmicini]
MDIPAFTRRITLFAAVVLAVPVLAAVPAVAQPESAHSAFAELDLISDLPGRAPLVDASLVNPWGLALSPTGPLWVANNGTNTATIYPGGAGGTPVTKAGLTVSVPGGAPTGQVFNDTTDFVVTGPGGAGPAAFMFVSEAGDLTAWNPTASRTAAITEAHVPGAVYKGLALLHTKIGPFLLAADFHHGRIDVFDKAFHRVALPDVFYRDRSLPRGYAPFNVAALGDVVYVAYAKQDADRQDEVDGRGLGFVDRFDVFGLVHHRVASRGALNAPWGLAIAPASFGRLAGDLLVGNFGDGRINAFDARSGHFHGSLRDAKHKPIAIAGLWDLKPGTAASGGADSLWFSAGTDHEAHGLVGLIQPAH